MAFTHVISNTWGLGGTLIGSQVAKTGGVEQNFSLALGTVTNQAVDLAWASAKLLSVFITTDVDCTLKLNSSGSPTDTITLAAGIPYQWVKGSGVTYPFTGTAGAVTTGFLTTTAATNVEIRVLMDL